MHISYRGMSLCCPSNGHTRLLHRRDTDHYHANIIGMIELMD